MMSMSTLMILMALMGTGMAVFNDGIREYEEAEFSTLEFQQPQSQPDGELQIGQPQSQHKFQAIPFKLQAGFNSIWYEVLENDANLSPFECTTLFGSLSQSELISLDQILLSQVDQSVPNRVNIWEHVNSFNNLNMPLGNSATSTDGDDDLELVNSYLDSYLPMNQLLQRFRDCKSSILSLSFQLQERISKFLTDHREKLLSSYGEEYGNDVSMVQADDLLLLEILMAIYHSMDDMKLAPHHYQQTINTLSHRVLRFSFQQNTIDHLLQAILPANRDAVVSPGDECVFNAMKDKFLDTCTDELLRCLTFFRANRFNDVLPNSVLPELVKTSTDLVENTIVHSHLKLAGIQSQHAALIKPEHELHQPQSQPQVELQVGQPQSQQHVQDISFRIQAWFNSIWYTVFQSDANLSPSERAALFGSLSQSELNCVNDLILNLRDHTVPNGVWNPDSIQTLTSTKCDLLMKIDQLLQRFRDCKLSILSLSVQLQQLISKFNDHNIERFSQLSYEEKYNNEESLVQVDTRLLDEILMAISQSTSQMKLLPHHYHQIFCSLSQGILRFSFAEDSIANVRAALPPPNRDAVFDSGTECVFIALRETFLVIVKDQLSKCFTFYRPYRARDIIVKELLAKMVKLPTDRGTSTETMRALPLMEQAFYRFLGSKPETTRKCDQFFIRAAKTYELPDPLALPPLLITKLSNTFKDALVKLASSFMVPIQSAPSPLKMQGVSS
uniref:Uncharacterized protein n=1 Tax=Spongospora subterranea TaxID=70186 RepID=A0A0H5QQU6_9EUKA|eukprot:CRZ04388.1 hypothetical protein [Spongospora subterranea]